MDAWKWQRRWFVLAMEAGYLYYFKSPDQMSASGVSPKVTINLRDCVVEDFQPDATMPAKRTTQRLDGGAGAVSLLIRIMHRVRGAGVAGVLLGDGSAAVASGEGERRAAAGRERSRKAGLAL